MKKFLFTLAALLMVGTAYADNYLYIEDFEVTPEFLAQTSGKAREMTLDVKAHYDQYVSAFMVWINSPEGITNRDALAGAAMTQSGYTRTGNPIDRQVALSVSENVNIFIAAWQEADYYYPDGSDPDEDDPVTVGSVKWAPGDYAQMFTLTVRFAQDFTGGDIMVITEPACSGTDPRGECCPKDEHWEHACHVTVAGAVTPEPAPVPTITMSDTYEVTAACADHQVVLMINGEPVQNPYQIEQTYEAQTITFTAYTVANADESGNSTEVTYVAEVPALPQPTAAEPVIEFAEDANGVTVSIENYTEYNITVDGVQVDPAREAHTYYVAKVYDKAQSIVVYAKNDPGAPYIASEDTKTYNLPAKEKAVNSTPSVSYSYENGELNVWAYGCDEADVAYTLYCDGVEYTGTFPIAVVAEEGYNHTWTATAVSPTTTVSAVSAPCAIVIDPIVEPGETMTFVKVTSADQLVAGKKYIFVCDGYAMGAAANGNFLTPIAITAGDEVEVGNDVAILTLGGTTGAYTFELNGSYLLGANGTALSFGDDANNAKWILNNNNGALDGYRARNAQYDTRSIKKHNTMDRFGHYANSDVNSTFALLYVEKGGDVPPVVAPAAPVITFSGEETATMTVTVTAEEGCTLIVNGEEINSNTYSYTVDRADIYTPGTVAVSAYAVKDGVQSTEASESKDFVVAQQPYAATPIITFAEDGSGVMITIENYTEYTIKVDGVQVDPTRDGEHYYYVEKVYDKAQFVEVYAKNAPGYPYIATEDTKTYNLPAKVKEQNSTPSVTYSYDPTTGELNVWAYGCTEAGVEYMLYCDGVAYNGTFPIMVNAEDGYNHTWTATAVSPTTTVSAESEPCAIVIDPVTPTPTTPDPTISVVTDNENQKVIITVEGQGTVTASVTDAAGTTNYTDEDGDGKIVIEIPFGEEVSFVTVNATAQNAGATAGHATESPIEIPKAQELETCVAPNGDYVIIDKEKALVTITNNEPGATVHYVVTLNGVVQAEGDFTGETWEYVASGVGDWVVSCVASLPGKNDSQPGGVFFPIAENQWPTAVDEMMAGKTISNVRYFNAAGQEMQEANGMTIVVTTYTDGTKSAVKVMK